MADEKPFVSLGDILTPEGTVPSELLPTKEEQLAAIRAAGLDWARQSVQPMSAHYIAPGHRLFIRVETSLASVDVCVAAFLQRIDGHVDEINTEVTGLSSEDAVDAFVDLNEGFLLSVSATTNTSGSQIGMTFITVGIARGGINDFIVPRILISRYVVTGQFVSWPHFPPLASTEGAGRIRVIDNSAIPEDPPNTLTVPDNRRWRFISGRALFTTDANAATRFVSLTMRVLGDTYFEVTDSDGISANTAIPLVFADVGQGSVVSNHALSMATPANLILLSGHILTISVTNAQSGDTLTDVIYLVEEWIERSP